MTISSPDPTQAMAESVTEYLKVLKEEGKVEADVIPVKIFIESENILTIELSDETYIELNFIAAIQRGEAE